MCVSENRGEFLQLLARETLTDSGCATRLRFVVAFDA